MTPTPPLPALHPPGLDKARCARRAMGALIPILLLLGVLGLARAHADGKVFPAEAVATDVRIPGQRALLVWSEGRQRMVIDTRFDGEGTHFAWVLPLPSPPIVDVTTTGIFPTLAWQTGPVVIHRMPTWFGWILAATGTAWLILHRKRNRAPNWTLILACIGISIGVSSMLGWGIPSVIAGLWVLLTVPLILARIRAQRPWASDVSLLGVLLLLLAGMGLPALSTASGGGPSMPNAGVQVIDRREVGIYETTTLRAEDPSSLVEWLGTNGYRISPGSGPVIADYIRDGWVFVASRLQRDTDVPGISSLPLLVFEFASEKPIYPLRLTGVGNGPLDLELFVLGPARATLPGFRTVDARPAAPGQPDRDRDVNIVSVLGRDEVHLVHPELARLAPDATFSTRLAATLSPTRMKSDAVIQWDGTQPARSTRYSRQGAILAVTSWVVSAWCTIVLGTAIGRRLQPWPGWPRLCAAGCAAALVLGLLTHALLPVTPVRMESYFARRQWERRVQGGLFLVRESMQGEPGPSEQEVRAAIRQAVADNPGAWPHGFREEDSPRNYRVQTRSSDVEVVYHDDWGRERVLRWRDEGLGWRDEAD